MSDQQPRQDIPDEVRHRHVINAADAREQATEMFSFLASTWIKVGDEEFEVPHKYLLDPEQDERHNELLAEIDRCDRYPDVPEIVNEDGKVIRPAGPGAVKIPHRQKGKLLKPLAERYAIMLWGEDAAARFKAGGGNFNLIEIIWAHQTNNLQARGESDSKSADSGSGVASAADGD